MKYQISIVAILATLAMAVPQAENDAANDGSGGVAAADNAEFAVALAANGDAGAVTTGADFAKATAAIEKGNNQDFKDAQDAVLDAAAAEDKKAN